MYSLRDFTATVISTKNYIWLQCARLVLIKYILGSFVSIWDGWMWRDTNEKEFTHWSVEMSALQEFTHWLEQICRAPRSLLPIYSSYCQCAWPSTLGSSIHLILKSNHTTFSSLEWSLVCMRKELWNYRLLCLSFLNMIIYMTNQQCVVTDFYHELLPSVLPIIHHHLHQATHLLKNTRRHAAMHFLMILHLSLEIQTCK